jgi:PAS domain S-box-containing protein
MNPWRDTALGLSAIPETGPLLLSAAPAWIWSRDGSRVLWANPAGGRTLGAASFGALWDRRWPEAHPLRRAIASLSRALPEQGMLARLRLTKNSLALPTACRCRLLRLPGDERGVLVESLEARGAATSPGALASFFAGPNTDVAILNAPGEAVVETSPGTAAAIAPATRQFEFADGDKRLRLYLVEHVDASAGPVREAPATPKLNAAGQVMRPIALAAEVSPASTSQVAASVRNEALAAEETRLAIAAARPLQGSAETDTARPISREPRALPPKRVANGETQKAEKPEQQSARSVMAGRVAQELSRKPVRFLWQTDAADRFLFVSPGLAQVVGRNAEVMGERWQEVSARLRLDPSSRIARALRQRDTWSGLTAWWPIEGSNVRVPVELTALPVFGADQSFQGYRGFGILRPAEALMPATFETRFGPVDALAEQVPPYEESVSTVPANVVPIRADIERIADHALTQQERNAFEEIAAALRERVIGDRSADAESAKYVEDEVAEPEAAEPVEETDAMLRDDAPAAPEPAKPEPPPPHSHEPKQQPPPPSRAEPPREIVVARPRLSQREAPQLGAQIADAQRRMREMTAILDTATDGVLIVDAKGTIESVNGSAEALFGLDANEMEGRPFGELLTPDTRKLALDYLSGLKDSGVASLLNEGREVDAIAGAGSIPLFMTMGRISGEEGGRFCAVLRDITHWKRIEGDLLAAKAAAEHASSQKSDFLARVSHEIRTPLNAIIGFAEVMIEERFGAIANERYREYLRDIRTSGEHVVSLVNDLLDISKIEAGKLDLHFAAVSLNEVVRESIALMQPQANRARVVLRSSLSRDVPAIVADERTLRQIVLNLLSNSVKFTGQGGQVIASTSLTENGEALLRVRDTGEGMSEEELARALEPFRQLSTSTMGDRSGTGLGLPLTKALVEANRATLSIKSARGEGTVVTVTIPATRVLSE